MKYSFFRSIMAQLLLLVLVSVLPALGIIIYSGLDRQSHEVREAENSAVKSVQSLAYNHEHTVESTRQFLMMLVKLPDVQNQNASACNKLFKALHKENPIYTSIIAVTPEGMVFANALSFTPYNIKHRKYFQDSLRTKEFSAGEYMIGITSGRRILPFAYPVIDSNGRVKAVIVVGIDLDRYGQVFTKTKLPPGSVFGMFDHKHISLYRYPDPEKYVGKVDSTYMVKHMSAGANEGVFAEVGVDGFKYLYAYKRFYLNGSMSPYLFMRVGIPYEQALYHARKVLFLNMALLFFAIIIAMISAWFIGNKVIARRLDKLSHASQQLAHGDLAVRTGLAHKKDELGQVAEAFDEMAATLEQKDSRQKLAEEALRLSEEKYRRIIETSQEGIIAVDENFHFTFVNARFAEMLGYSPDELIGKDPICITFEEDIPELLERRKKRRQGIIEPYERKFRCKDGSTLWLHISMTPIMDENGQFKGSFAMHADITQRKLAEEALQQSEEKYRSIFENSAEGICQTTPDGRFISVNPALARIYGYESPEEVLSSVTNIAKQLYVNPEERIQYKGLLEKHGAVKNFEHRSYRKDGTIAWISLNTHVVKDTSGKILYFDTMVEDITRRKEAEELLKQEKETLFTILESDPCGIAVVGRNGVYRYVNPEFTKITGYTLTDIKTGRDWFQKTCPDPEYREQIIGSWKNKMQKEGKSIDTEFTITCKDSSLKNIEFRTTLLKDFSITVMNDITERKELEEKLRTMSIVDDLTGLYNRRGFFTLVQQQFKLSERTPRGMILFFSDIDRMKWINDTLGHKEGDRALIDTASILRQTFRESDIIGRMGGDEFAILAIDATDETRVALTQRLKTILDQHIESKNNKYKLSLSVGSIHYDHKNPASLDELIAQADKLMYQEKRKKHS